MVRKSMLLGVLLVLMFGTFLWGDLVSYHTFEEGSGTATSDVTGNGNDGTFDGGVEWVAGYKGGGVHFDTPGERINIGPIAPAVENDAMTLAAWINWEGMGGSTSQQGIIGKRLGWASGAQIKWFWQAQPSGALIFRADAGDGGTGLWWGNTYLVPYANEWTHVAVTWDDGAAVQYINAEEVSTGNITFRTTADATPVTIGCVSSTNSETFIGTIDEARIYNTALTPAEIGQAMVPGAATGASGPLPASGSTDVRRDVTLSWLPGEFAASHDVYFGLNANDVNEASRTDDRGVLVSEGHTEASYNGGWKLQLNTTYYWRVDEVNAPSAPATFKGGLWSFTTEPESYPLAVDTATASSQHLPTTGPENVINGSGLNANGEHSTSTTAMWMTAATDMGPWWIQFAFDQAYALHEMQVWNHNQAIETLLGFGAKDVTIDTSLDGETWTALEGVSMLNQATGAPTDMANSTVAFNSVLAQYVRITIHSNYGGVVPQTGLSEVQFSYVPMIARAPVPADGSTLDGTEVVLGWRPGREADQHEVVYSSERSSVIDGSAVVTTIPETTYNPGPLDLGSAYFWRINEVNDAGVNPRYEGSLWKFKTPESLTLEDFELYEDAEFLEIWAFWADGYEDNSNGSIVGTGDSGNEPETSIVQEGRQSLPMSYDNTSAPVSEATRTFDTPLDMSKGNPENVGMYFHGAPAGFVENTDGSITMSGIGADIHNGTDEFNFAYKTLNGDGSITARIDSIQDTAEWAKAGVMIRRSLTPDDVYVHAIGTPRDRSEIKFREITGMTTTGGSNNPEGDTPLPLWLRLIRAGDTIKAERSADGVAWSPLITDDEEASQVELFMTGPIYIGLVVTSNTDAPCTAVFSNVTTSGGVSGSWQLEAMSVPQPNNDAAPVYMVLTDSSNKSARIEHPDPAATQIGAWTLLSAPVSDLGVNLSHIKSITIGVGGANVMGTLYADNIHVSTPYKPFYDLMAHYTLEGDATDSSGNGFDGIVSGEPVYIDGAVGQGLEFDGTGDQYVTIGTVDPSFYSGQLSLSLFAKWNGLSGSYQGLIGKRNLWAADNMMWDLEIHRDNGTLYTHRNGGPTVDMGAMPEGEWTHIAATYNGVTAQLYKNGELAANGPYTFGPTTDATLVFGCCERNGGNPFNGALDEVRIYDRVLSEAEVADLAAQ